MDRINPFTAIIREHAHTHSFGLECPSVSVEHHTRCTKASIRNSLNCTTPRHAKRTKAPLLKQNTSLNLVADTLIVANKTFFTPGRDGWTVI